MKTLAHHTLIFDEDCPLCRAYTGAFIKTGMLDENGREAYQRMHTHTCLLIDKDRARNEIALVNTKTGQVLYGIDSLMRVLGHAWPIFRPLFNFQPFKWCMVKLYAFISYNRKVIMPAAAKTTGCEPALRKDYRWAYLLFTWFITSLLLSRYTLLLTPLLPPSEFVREFSICGGQIGFQWLVLSLVNKHRRLDYLGNMMSISMAGALLLAIAQSVFALFNFHNSMLAAGLFMAVVGLMFGEHLRRMKLLNIHWIASLTWVLYRVIVLFILF